MDVTIIGMDDKAIGVSEAVELRHTEEQFTLFAKLPLSVQLAAGNGIGFTCVDGRYRIFEITKREIVEPDGVWEVTAIDKAVRELMDEPIEEQRARNISIYTYAGRLIQNTRFTLGTVTSLASATTSAYYESVWSALEGAADAYNVNIIPYYTFTNGLVTGRYIDITDTLGADRGRLFEFGDDMTGVRVTYDDSNVKTALYGRGRGVEIESEEGDVSYGRRLTFADVVWSTSSGDPVNKPLNQEWVADPAAQAAFGRDGRNRFGFAVFEDCTDAEQLLQLTWQQLQKQKDPAISISASIVDTERLMGHSHEAVRLGDPVLVRIPAKKLDIRANISAIVRDYIHPEQTQLTISNAAAVATGTSAGKIMANIQQTVGGVSAKSDVWDRAGEAFDINGVMNVMRNQIISTTGNWYTDPDTGAIMMVSADGTKAMMLNGSGWMIANGKTGNTWNWRTAATGSGIVADEITTGKLNANLIEAGSLSLGKLKTGSVFTSINDAGITVRHTSAGNAYTTLDASGLRIFNASNVNIGGIYVPTGQSEVKAGFTSLFNPVYPNFSIQLIRKYDTESGIWYYGLGLFRKDTLICGIGVEDSDSPGGGFLFGGNNDGVSIAKVISAGKAV